MMECGFVMKIWYDLFLAILQYRLDAIHCIWPFVVDHLRFICCHRRQKDLCPIFDDICTLMPIHIYTLSDQSDANPT